MHVYGLKINKSLVFAAGKSSFSPFPVKLGSLCPIKNQEIAIRFTIIPEEGVELDYIGIDKLIEKEIAIEKT